VKEYALRRMGVGYALIDYLMESDRMNVQHVRTSYMGTAMHFTVKGELYRKGE
jgi:hypothetical protein